ncbi:hypothetical protein [Mycoplasmopsis cricetuli]|uniref:hypothetical protein n=1 Tax=Mycoplasmopsis cricetuli TaxID=171283 RepID=UPI00046F5299|nr:hypothetical protein [Mycoplasmopsis cricetuli]
MKNLKEIINLIENSNFHLSLKGYKKEEVDLMLNQILTYTKIQLSYAENNEKIIQNYQKQIEELKIQKDILVLENKRLQKERSKNEQR